MPTPYANQPFDIRYIDPALIQQMMMQQQQMMAQQQGYPPQQAQPSMSSSLLSSATNAAAKKAINMGMNKLTSSAGADIPSALAQNATQNAAFNSGADLSSALSSNLPMTTVDAGRFPVASLQNGGTLLSDGTAVPGAATAAQSGWSLSGIGGAGNYFLPAAGVAGAVDLFSNKRHGGRGALQGAASGAAIGSYFGPVGTVTGAVIGAGAGYFGNFGDKDRFLTEWNRKKALFDKGLGPDPGPKPMMGRSKAELVNPAYNADFVGNTYGNGWVNNKFANSRAEGDLTPTDLRGYAFTGEKLGNDWYKASQKTQDDILAKLLSSNAIREHHGTVDATWSPELEAYAKEQIAKDTKGKK